MQEHDFEALVADLAPVRRVKATTAWLIAACGTMAAVLLVSGGFGLRTDIRAGHPDGLVLLRGGMLLLLGCAALVAVAASARPGVGQVSHGWRWALSAALLFPLVTAGQTVVERQLPWAELTSPSGPWCLAIAGVTGLVIGSALTLWLRRGAPVDPTRAGWLVGLTAGAFGTFAYSLHCPSETLQYVGIWYSAAIGLCAVMGRAFVPPLVRW